jgi:hypothetical protein
MPKNSRFYPSLSGVKPGEVVLINASLPGIPGGVPVSTGVLVLYADEDMFTVMTPAGHPESGFNTFSSYQEGGVTVAQIQSLARANDPIYEVGFRSRWILQQERIASACQRWLPVSGGSQVSAEGPFRHPPAMVKYGKHHRTPCQDGDQITGKIVNTVLPEETSFRMANIASMMLSL